MPSSMQRKKSKSKISDRKGRKIKINENDKRKSTAVIDNRVEDDNKTTTRSKSGKIALLSIVVVILWRRYGFTFPLNEFSSIQSWTTDSQRADKNADTDKTSVIISHRITTNPKEKINRFLAWLEESGAVISPFVSISSFSDYGGYGLIALNPDQNKPTQEIESNHESSQELPQQNEYIIHARQEIFTIPSSIIISSNSVIHKVAFQKIPFFQNRLNRVLTTHFQSPLVQQDVVVALQLMVECAIGEDSYLKPYLDILPIDIVPRLDTFNNEELAMLQDDDLVFLAKSSFQSLDDFWNYNSTHYNGRHASSEVQALLLAMIEAQVATKITADTTNGESLQSSSESTTALSDLEKATCTSFKAFHKYMSIVSSRAMILNGRKYLTPMADMANYAPRNNDHKNNQQGRGTGDNVIQSSSFELYHKINDVDNSITVYADRNFRPNEQIFEDYGDVDNSLYLEAHGFVPEKNPHHCAMISSQYLPVDPHAFSDELWNIFVTLNIVPPLSTNDRNLYIPALCVRSDRTLNDDGAVAYLKLAALLNSDTEQQMKCINSLDTEDIEFIRLQCLEYAGNGKVLQDIISESARRAVVYGISSVEDDVALLNSIANKQKTDTVVVDESMIEKDTYKMEMALKFRISDKQILSIIGVLEGDIQCNRNNVEEQVRGHDMLS